jgi:hypothetical protein
MCESCYDKSIHYIYQCGPVRSSLPCVAITLAASFARVALGGVPDNSARSLSKPRGDAKADPCACARAVDATIAPYLGMDLDDVHVHLGNTTSVNISQPLLQRLPEPQCVPCEHSQMRLSRVAVTCKTFGRSQPLFLDHCVAHWT